MRPGVGRGAFNASRSSQKAKPIEVMVVDDSAIVRGLLTRTLESDGEITVSASVGDGKMAINSLKRRPVDVVVLDIEMPVMDGLTALPKLLEINKDLTVIVASTLTHKNAEISLKCMALGAADYLAKPDTRDLHTADSFKRDLVEKVKALGRTAQGRTKRRHSPTFAARSFTSSSAMPVRTPANSTSALRAGLEQARSPKAIAIGSSTGGPQALFEVLGNLKGVKQPIFVTQHMPPKFTEILAGHIRQHCGIDCVEVKDGDAVQPGVVHLAPGDWHMGIEQTGTGAVIRLSQSEPENYCRPAVDYMVRSLDKVYGKTLALAILTGMGSDGAKGVEMVAESNGVAIAQDEDSSVVWGMPKAAAATGKCQAILPLNKIGPKLRELAQRL
ncbi:MAG: chemotaxis response regulator protein-glutamate methylesterase [Alphaproteobacteria bacterium]